MLQNKIRKHKVHHFVSRKTTLKFRSSKVPNPARFSNFRVNSPEWLVSLLFGIYGSLQGPSNIKPSPRKREKEHEKQRGNEQIDRR